MRILAVAQRLAELPPKARHRGAASPSVVREPVGRSPRRRPPCARRPWRQAPCAASSVVAPLCCSSSSEHARVVLRIDDHRHVGMVLRRGADHRRPADVDVLDAILVARALGDGRLERIEIHHQQIDRLDAVLRHRAGMFLVAAHRQQAAMHLRMQGLDPAVHHFGKAGELRDIQNLEAGVLERLGGAAGRNQLDAVTGKRPGEFDQPALVGHRQQGAFDPARLAAHMPNISTDGAAECKAARPRLWSDYNGNSGSSARASRWPRVPRPVWLSVHCTFAWVRAWP